MLTHVNKPIPAAGARAGSSWAARHQQAPASAHEPGSALAGQEVDVAEPGAMEGHPGHDFANVRIHGPEDDSWRSFQMWIGKPDHESEHKATARHTQISQPRIPSPRRPPPDNALARPA